MSRVVPLLIVGITLFIGGLYWSLWNDASTYLDNFVVHDEYYELVSFIWRMIPAVLLFVGVICLILAGISAAQRTEVFR